MASISHLLSRRHLAQNAADLFPGYFALVMATGIVSIAAFLLEMVFIAQALLVVNVIAYAILWLLMFWRLFVYFPRVITDIKSHARGPGFFTLIAGTCMLGTQLLLVVGSRAVAWGLWGLGIFLWLVVMYAFFTAVTTRPQKPTLETGINGAWLIATVATQAVSILGTLLLAGMPKRPTHLICGMLNTKDVRGYLRPLAPHVASLHAVSIPGETNTLPAETTAAAATDAGMPARTAASVAAALDDIAQTDPQGRVLICGSLYLAGAVLRENG